MDSDIGYLNPAAVNHDCIKGSPEACEEYLYTTLLKLQYKNYILLPYNFKYTTSIYCTYYICTTPN